MHAKKAITTESRDFRAVLQSELLKRCKSNPAYSMRAFAKQLGLEPSYLSKILARKRAVTPKLIEKLCPRLGLSHIEAQLYLKQDSCVPFHDISLDQFEIISNWYHVAILELMLLPNFENSPDWIAKKLGIKTTEAKRAIERLLRTKMIEKNEDGKLQNTKGSYTTTGSPFTTAAFRKVQKQILKQAMTAMEEVPFEKRDQSAITVAIDDSRIPEAKERIKKFRRKLSDFLQSSGKPLNEVYQISISLFPVSKSSGLKSILAFAAIASSLVMNAPKAQAGGQETHGGGAIVCRNQTTHEITSVRLYDLYEAEKIYRLPPSDFSGMSAAEILDKIYVRAEENVGEGLAQDLQHEVQFVRSRTHYQKNILPIQDANWFLAQSDRKNCYYKQLASWSDRDHQISIQRQYFDLLSPADQAALYLHEALYHLYRLRWKNKTSDYARQLNGQFFSQAAISNLGLFLSYHDLGFKHRIPEGIQSNFETAYAQWFGTQDMLWYRKSFREGALRIRALNGPIGIAYGPEMKEIILHTGEEYTIPLADMISVAAEECHQKIGNSLSVPFIFHAAQPFDFILSSTLGSGSVIYRMGKIKKSKPTINTDQKFMLQYNLYLEHNRD